MENNLTATNSIVINQPVEKVWQALTDPELIRQYLFGTEARSDWQKGSSITYTGEWKGKHYEDKGQIIDLVPNKRLHTTYLSGLSGEEDKPENYAHVIYELEEESGGTRLTIRQDHIKDEAGLQHMNENWGMVLSNMKRVLEG